MRLRIALKLFRMAVSMLGYCPCRQCIMQAREDARLRRFGGKLPRAERRRVLRDAISNTSKRMRF